MESVSRVLIKIDQAMDRIPVASTVNNIVDLFIKAVLSVSSSETVRKSHYYTHLNDKSALRCLALTVPIWGQFFLFVYDLFHEKPEGSKKAVHAPVNEIAKKALKAEPVNQAPKEQATSPVIKKSEDATPIAQAEPDTGTLVVKKGNDEAGSGTLVVKQVEEEAGSGTLVIRKDTTPGNAPGAPEPGSPKKSQVPSFLAANETPPLVSPKKHGIQDPQVQKGIARLQALNVFLFSLNKDSYATLPSTLTKEEYESILEERKKTIKKHEKKLIQDALTHLKEDLSLVALLPIKNSLGELSEAELSSAETFKEAIKKKVRAIPSKDLEVRLSILKELEVLLWAKKQLSQVYLIGELSLDKKAAEKILNAKQTTIYNYLQSKLNDLLTS